MNEIVATIVLAIIQGIAEWFPVSSSSHLVIFSHILGFENSLAFDVALHFGTLMAVFVYFGRDIVDIVRDLLTGKWKSEHGKLGILLIIAAIPAALFGYFMSPIMGGSFGNLGLIAMGLAVTSMLLFIASTGFQYKKNGKLGYAAAITIGLVQMLAIFRGVSRTGSTVSAGLLYGLNEKTAVKFSFLLSIPIVFGANIISIGNNAIPTHYIWAALIAFVVGLLTINLSYKYVLSNRKNLRWFALYTLLLAIGLGVYVMII